MGHRRGTDAAALDVTGAALGCPGLASFALAVWLLTPSLGIWSLGVGSILWLVVSVTCWRMRRGVGRPHLYATLKAKRGVDANQPCRKCSKRINVNST
jgi:hypothetical protein